MVKKFLNAPGPTAVPQEILNDMAAPLIHHRTPQFSTLVKENGEMLKELFQTKRPVITLNSSGTGAMEASVSNFLSRGDKVIVISGGKFGERFAKIARAYGIEVVELKVEYGFDIKKEALAEALTQNPDVKAVYTEYSETSTGVAYDIEGFASVVKKTDAILVADGITAIGAMPFYMDKWGVDVALAGAQKSLMIPPGLAFLAYSEKAEKLLNVSDLPKFYFDIKAETAALAKNTTSWTPAITLYIGLHRALKMILEEGLENVWKRHAVIAEAVRNSVKTIGMKLFVNASARPSDSVTSVKVPDGVDGAKIPALMRDKYGVTIAGGQGTMKGNIIRLGHLGYVDKSDVVVELQALEYALAELGYEFEYGAAVAAGQKYVMEHLKY